MYKHCSTNALGISNHFPSPNKVVKSKFSWYPKQLLDLPNLSTLIKDEVIMYSNG